MATTNPAQARLASALKRMKSLQDQGKTVFRAADLSREEKTALTKAGFIRPVVKGWYMASKPGEGPGDSTPWFAALRDFVVGYCNKRFGGKWYLAPIHSVEMHAGQTALPKQLVIHSSKGSNSVLDLPGGCSLLDYRPPGFPMSDAIEEVGGLRVLPLSTALVRVPETFFQAKAADAQIALARIVDASDINRELLNGGHTTVAGRLAGAFRAIGRSDLAGDILGSMRAAGYTVTEKNPFTREAPVLSLDRARSPYTLRLQLMWRTMREDVISAFPHSPGLPANKSSYMAAVEEGYKADAYHSLSIEGYRVTDELIERVASGAWNPEQHASDTDARNAMAAHGYWRAFERVKQSLERILENENPGAVARGDHGAWYRELFSPSVEAGIISASDLAGYRNGAVYIRNAAHVPPPREAVREMMPALFDLLKKENNPAVRAVLGHFLFEFIHPYMDGNGRTGRFLMNAMLASGGYPWTIVRVEWRDAYLAALDAASAHSDIKPLAAFLAAAVNGDSPAPTSPAHTAGGIGISIASC